MALASPALRAAACLAVLFGQALPVAHELRVARAEEGHAFSVPSGPALCASRPASHDHHDQDRCEVCPVSARLRAGIADHAAPASAAAIRSSIRTVVAPTFAPGRLWAPFLSRGPPRA